MNWYQYTKNQLALELKTNLENGLNDLEAKDRLIKFGLNILPEKKPDSWLILFIRQFQSPLIYILLFCAILVFYTGEHTDGLIILAVLIINAVIGTYQEGKSGKILSSLNKLTSVEVTVIRQEKEIIVQESEVVPGDLLILSEGQKVAADARVVFSYNLNIDESLLTGETGGVQKKDQIFNEENLPILNQHNMVFKGSSVLSGTGRAVVVETGISTQIGKISQALLEPTEEIPLQKNIRNLSKLIIFAVLFISLFMLGLGWQLHHTFKEMLALVISLAVSIIPEGLPLILTVILAHGVWRLAKKHALVKKMQAVEALGQANILAVDKTGTLTENQMVIKKIFVGKNAYEVSGDGYDNNGQVLLANKIQLHNSDILQAAIVSSLASKAKVYLDSSTGIYKITGDPTEAAMTVFGEKLGQPLETLLEKYREVEEIPFDYKNKYRAVYYKEGGQIFCAMAGAPEAVIPKCTHYLEHGFKRQISLEFTKQLEQTIQEFSSLGLRLVVIAYKYPYKSDNKKNFFDLTFTALFGIKDALRPQAKIAVNKAISEGIKVVMITGDHKITAKAIAEEAGILPLAREEKKSIQKESEYILTGSDLQTLSESELAQKIKNVRVFARVTPEDKMKIIRAYKKAGLIIAMTGDGVNDAPSLVAADLGVAMGKIGTEVAKEAADIILLDDNLSTIITAIKEGRVMHTNIKKALQFLFSTSLGELFTVLFALIFNLPLPVLAVQILWLNLVTDPLLGAALALEQSEDDAGLLQHSKPSKYFIDYSMLVHMLMVGLIMAVGGLWLFNLYTPMGILKAQTMALTLLAVFQWYNGLNCRFLYHSIFNKRILGNRYVWVALIINILLQYLAIYNPVMQKILHTTALNFLDYILVISLGFVLIIAEEIRKFFVKIGNIKRNLI